MVEVPTRIVQERLRENYPKVAGDLLEPLIHFTTVARRVYGGDSDKVLIMMVIAARTLQHPDFASLAAVDLEGGRPRVFPSLGVSIRSIAASTGIPRETVRRKSAELVEAGALVRVGSDLRLTVEWCEASAPEKRAFERLAVQVYDVVNQLLAGLERGARPGAKPELVWEDGT